MTESPSVSTPTASHAAYAGGVPALFAVTGWVLCLIGGYSFPEALDLVARRSYQPHHNFMTYIFISGLSLTCYLFLMIAVTVMTMRFAARTFEGILKPFADWSWAAHARRVTVIAVIGMFAMQLISLHGYWGNARQIFGGKAGYAKTNIQQTKMIAEALGKAAGHRPYKAALVTDLDTRDGKGLLERHILAYFLWPVDISGIYQKEDDAWIAFHKKDAARHVPAGYTVLYQIDDENLIAVVAQK